MNPWLYLIVVLLTLTSTSCAGLSTQQRTRAVEIALSARSTEIDCTAAHRCAQASSLRGLAGQAFAESTNEAAKHYALLLDNGEDALLTRINLIRSATHRIDLQTYIFDTDDSARLTIDELLIAARRGIRVRVLIDQLSAISDLEVLAALAGAHENFELRVYNPTFNRATANYLHYAASVICCFRKFNQRMHNKLLIVDSAVGITGGRNYQDDYYDWDPHYNFRDRDVLIAGPAVWDMAQSFEHYWGAPRSVPVERLNDVARKLLREGVPALPDSMPHRPERVERVREEASDAALIDTYLTSEAIPVAEVLYLADAPEKHQADYRPEETIEPILGQMVESAQQEIMLQTPYLVLSKQAQRTFQNLRARTEPPRIIVSTNSLAATDNPAVYSVAFKYKRRNMRSFGFELYEYKPFPLNAPVDYTNLLPWPKADANVDGASDGGSANQTRELTQTDAVDDDSQRKRRGETRSSLWRGSAHHGTKLLPVNGEGARMGLHAKSMVIDRQIAIIGTHNFDPRSENYNTEGIVVIRDTAFAQVLAHSIRRDIEPENSWIVAPRVHSTVLSGLNYSAGKVSEALPILDFWPWRYATNYEFQPSESCLEPLPSYRHPDFYDCYVPVGDFPGVAGSSKALLARMLLVIGAGLATPIM